MPKFICLTIFISLCLMNTAQAHRTKVFAWVDGTNVAGEVYFGGGDRAKGAKVELLIDTKVVASTNADEMGEFIFKQLEAKDYLVSANAGQGHVATFEITRGEFPELSIPVAESIDLSQGEPKVQGTNTSRERCEVLNEAAMSKALRPLRNQLDQYETKIRWHDVLGGIGYILGLFGLWSLMRSRRG